MFRRFLLCRQATALLEFAFLLPVFLAMMVGIMEFGRAMWIRQTLQYAVESASRTALADSSLSTSSISGTVTSDLIGLQGVVPVVTVTSSATQITVFASYNFTFLVPGLLPFGPLTLTAQSNLPR